MLQIRKLGIEDYHTVWQDMKTFTSTRNPETQDEFWILEHAAVYTQGQAGKPEHLLNPQEIPVVQSDRGGQVTYHGPGQIVAYALLDLKRRNIGIRTLVSQLETSLIRLLSEYSIVANIQCGAPGVYVEGKKIASIGLRVKNACTYHGIALNVDMDLQPFKGINPCGFSQLEMTQISDWVKKVEIEDVKEKLSMLLHEQFGN